MGTCYHDGMLGPNVKLCVFQPICAISRIISKSGDGSNHTIQKNDGQILKLQRLGRYTTKITRRSLITGPSPPDFGAARLLIHWSQMTSQRFQAFPHEAPAEALNLLDLVQSLNFSSRADDHGHPPLDVLSYPICANVCGGSTTSKLQLTKKMNHHLELILGCSGFAWVLLVRPQWDTYLKFTPISEPSPTKLELGKKHVVYHVLTMVCPLVN